MCRFDGNGRQFRKPGRDAQIPEFSGFDLVHDLVHNKNLMEVNVHEAKTHLSRLLQRVEAGEEITIARAGVPVARLIPAEPRKQKRKLGFYGDSIRIAADFDAPLPDDLLAAFLGTEPVRARKKAGKK